MIGKLKGEIEEICDEYCLVDVRGVSYIVQCSTSLIKTLGVGERVSLFISTIIKDDLPYLYGFSDRSEQEVFTFLISVQGVGAKMAMHIMSDIPLHQLVQSVQEGNFKIFTTVQGVGPKIANRIVNELKASKKFLSIITSAKINEFSNLYQSKQDAISALVNLGFKRVDVVNIVDEVTKESNEKTTIEQIIKNSIARLAK